MFFPLGKTFFFIGFDGFTVKKLFRNEKVAWTLKARHGTIKANKEECSRKTFVCT